MAAFEGLVQALREGDDAAKTAAVRALGRLDWSELGLMAEAGGIAPLVQLLRVGSAEAKYWAAAALCALAYNNDDNRVAIAAAGGIAPLVELLHNERGNAKWRAAQALEWLALNNDANAVAVAADVGLEALIELARRGRVTVDMLGNLADVHERRIVRNAGIAAKRKAALVVAALLGGCVPDSVPRVLKAIIGSYL